jgi:hypothetical protein
MTIDAALLAQIKERDANEGFVLMRVHKHTPEGDAAADRRTLLGWVEEMQKDLHDQAERNSDIAAGIAQDRDEARAALASATRENALACVIDRNQLIDDRDHWKAIADGLAEYTWHDPDCHEQTDINDGMCNCGLSKALAAYRAAKGEA